MLLAGGQGSRLYALTSRIAKPAVPFGAKNRIIDFPLSNCANSGIDTVGVLTQFEPHVLHAYIGNGQPWDLDRAGGGVHMLPPYHGLEGGKWYKGSANALYHNIAFVDQYDPEVVVVLSGDHIYRMDYNKMVAAHKQKGAACTIAIQEVPWEEAPRCGILSVDGDGFITEFVEKPKEPKSNLASMGIYTFTWEALRRHLIEDEADPNSKNDMGGNIITRMLTAKEPMLGYKFTGYWRDVGTLEALWESNMDMLSPQGLTMFDKDWRLYGNTPPCPPHFIGADAVISHSEVADGCEIYGEVENSIISYQCKVAAGAKVKYSILMPGAVVG